MDFHSQTNVKTCLDIRANPDPTIQSQYSASQTIIALVESSRVNILPDADIELFYKNIVDIETAQGVGLDIWGRILGIGRNLDIEETDGWFGFAEADYEPFGYGPFWDGAIITQQTPLADDAYRVLLMWKALANIATADAASLNALLQGLFAGQEIVVRERDVMEIELYIYFQLEPYQKAILDSFGLMGRGAGVGMTWTEIPLPVFGFAEADYEPFNQAPFWNGGQTPRRDNSLPFFGFAEADCQPFGQYPFWDGSASSLNI